MAWQRSKYPLQAPTLGSKQQHPGDRQHPLDPVSETLQNSLQIPAPDLTIPSNEHLDQCPVALKPLLNGDENSHLPTEANKTDIARFSTSLNSTSLQANEHAHQLPSEGPETSISGKSSSSDHGPPVISSTLNRNAHPLQASTAASTEYSVSEPEHEHSRKRSLRRTPGSGSLKQIASEQSLLGSSQESLRSIPEANTSPTGEAEEQLHVPAAITSTWKRQNYPVQAPTDGSTPEQALSAHSALDGEEDPTPATGNKLYPMQLSTADCTVPAEPHLSTDPYEASGNTSSYQAKGSSQANTASGLRHRKGYPLQSPASNANLQRPPTPPDSPHKDQEEVRDMAAMHQNSQPTAQSNSLRRKGYPLQSPASMANLQRQLTPPPSPTAATVNFVQQPTNSTHGPNRSSQSSRSFRRQAYPLQSQASVPALRRSPEPEISPHGLAHPMNPLSAKQSREHELATKVINQWHGAVKDRAAGSIHLPKNIRAVQDAGQDPGGRTIIVCLDGTGDKFDNDNSNIVHLISALKKDDPRQVTYYQAGIGTYGEGGLSGGLTAALDMAVGSGLGLHVRDAYHFLMHAYKEGDKICIFGFSRGAYTARCLAGMIHKVGLLPPRNIQQIPFAYEFYANNTVQGWQQSIDFKATFCIDVNVYYLGCFDSVASVGFIPRTLPLSSTPGNKPRYFRHAMALDERRAKFKICRHQNTDWDDVTKSEDLAKEKNTRSKHPNLTDEDWKRLTANEAPFDTDALEVWFIGAHADVGGGAVANTERHKLAQIPLRWMIRQAFECDTGIIFKTRVLAEFGLDVHTLWPKYERLRIPAEGTPSEFLQRYTKVLPPKSVRGGKLVATNKHEGGEQLFRLNSHMDEDWTPELVEDFFDVMAPLNDQLVQAPGWWILELWPVQYKIPNVPGEYTVRVGPNLGRYRCVEDVKPKVHWTVLRRGQRMGYKIKARAPVGIHWQTVV